MKNSGQNACSVSTLGIKTCQFHTLKNSPSYAHLSSSTRVEKYVGYKKHICPGILSIPLKLLPQDLREHCSGPILVPKGTSSSINIIQYQTTVLYQVYSKDPKESTHHQISFLFLAPIPPALKCLGKLPKKKKKKKVKVPKYSTSTAPSPTDSVPHHPYSGTSPAQLPLRQYISPQLPAQS